MDNKNFLTKSIKPGEIVPVTTKHQLKNILNNNSKVIVKFEGVWCKPCHKISRFYEQISREYHGKLLLCKVDIDLAEELTKREKIESVPTFKFYCRGKLTNITTGASEEKLTEAIKNLMENRD